jgi:hypothetical protein
MLITAGRQSKHPAAPPCQRGTAWSALIGIWGFKSRDWTGRGGGLMKRFTFGVSNIAAMSIGRVGGRADAKLRPVSALPPRRRVIFISSTAARASSSTSQWLRRQRGEGGMGAWR